jgi:hypothetical protein
MSMTGGETEALTGRMQCRDLTRAMDFYASHLKGAGFQTNTINTNQDGRSMRMMTASKDKFTATLTTDPENEGFAVIVLASPGTK